MVSVGIDVAKDKSTVCILSPYGEIIRTPFDVMHDEIMVQNLIDELRAAGDELKIVMEATGAYHLPLLQQLKAAGFFVCVVNPLVMKRYAATEIRKAKTDKLDAVRIANYGIDHWFRLTEYQPPEAVYEELRLLGRQYYQYNRMNTQCKVRLNNILDRTMPGLRPLFGASYAQVRGKDKLCDFVSAYWHYDCITKMSEVKFIQSYNAWSKKKGYRANNEKAQQIYALARTGIPTLPSNPASTKMLVQEAVNAIQVMNSILFRILSQMQSLAKQLPEYITVRSMAGVGDILAPCLIAEIGDVRRFANGKCLIAYAGIDAPPFQSGTFSGSRRSISKRGSPVLRKAGFEAMQCLKRNKPTEDNAVYLYILKKEEEGKPKKVAKIAGLNKFLRIYYARVSALYA